MTTRLLRSACHWSSCMCSPPSCACARSRCLPTNVHVICCDDLAYHGDIKDTGDLWTNRYQKFLEKEGPHEHCRAADYLTAWFVDASVGESGVHVHTPSALVQCQGAVCRHEWLSRLDMNRPLIQRVTVQIAMPR